MDSRVGEFDEVCSLFPNLSFILSCNNLQISSLMQSSKALKPSSFFSLIEIILNKIFKNFQVFFFYLKKEKKIIIKKLQWVNIFG